MIATLDRPRAPQPQTQATAQFRAEVLRGLSASDRELPCKFFYDAAGSELFEKITQLDEYYLTRAELAIMQRHAAEMGDLLGRHCLLIEYGSGSSTKTRLLLDRLLDPVGYVPVDVSCEYLQRATQDLARDYPRIEMLPLCADFTGPLQLPAPRLKPRRRVVYFPGSTIGNLLPADATALLRQTAQLCGTSGGMLLGADLRKDRRILEAAYDDRQGVTAQFNRNILVRINRELDADFDIDAYAHRAIYDPVHGRIEMHLVSLRDQCVHIGDRDFFFRAGESIRTEYSYKYTLRHVRQMAEAAGFSVEGLWTDGSRSFSVHYLAARHAP